MTEFTLQNIYNRIYITEYSWQNIHDRIYTTKYTWQNKCWIFCFLFAFFLVILMPKSQPSYPATGAMNSSIYSPVFVYIRWLKVTDMYICFLSCAQFLSNAFSSKAFSSKAFSSNPFSIPIRLGYIRLG